MAAFADVSPEEAQQAYEQGRALAEGRQDLPVRAELLLSYAGDQLRRGDAAKAVKLAAEAVQLAVDGGARELIGRFRMPLLLTHGTAGYPREGLALVSEAGGSEWLTEPIGPDNYISRGLYSLLLAWLGDLPEARCQLEAVLAYAEATQRLTSWLHVNAVDLGWFSGDHSQVMREGQRALQRAEEFGSSLFRALALRGLGFAHVLAGDPHAAVSLLEKALPLVAPGAHAHQFQPNTLSTLARAYLRTGAIDRAHQSAVAAIASAQASHSRVWEILCWLAYFNLPTAGPWSARVPEGIARVAELIDSSGAEGTRPWWWEARARWAATSAERESFTIKAIEAFDRMGAPKHVERLRGQRDSAEA
jgi:tetratricopeptide (TPR) repeat protein